MALRLLAIALTSLAGGLLTYLFLSRLTKYARETHHQETFREKTPALPRRQPRLPSRRAA